jgi:hypothetical protein
MRNEQISPLAMHQDNYCIYKLVKYDMLVQNGFCHNGNSNFT